MTIKDLIDKWSRVTEVKDLGDLGSAFDNYGYKADGFRPLDAAERKLIRAFIADLREVEK